MKLVIERQVIKLHGILGKKPEYVFYVVKPWNLFLDKKNKDAVLSDTCVFCFFRMNYFYW